jgi:hypothetical protein
VAAGERPATAVQKRNSAAAVPATVVCITAKPGTTPAKGAWRSGDRYALSYDLPELASPTSRTKHEHDGISFDNNIDAFGRHPHPRQGVRKALSSA